MLSPFRALRYAVPDPELPMRTSPPYDVVDAVERSAREQLSPTNVVRLILPRSGEDPAARAAADLPQLPDPYEQAAATLSAWRARGVLRPDARPALYVYEQAPDGAPALRGLVGAAALSPAEHGVVLPHEDVVPGPVADRLALHSAVRADLEPVMLAASLAGTGVPELLEQAGRAPALVDTRIDGARHRLWAVEDPHLLQTLAAALLPLRAVVLDGHHRWASHLERQAVAHAAGRGPGPWDFGLALLVDTGGPGLRVDAVHRALPAVAPGQLAAMAEAAHAVTRVRRLDGAGLQAGLEELRRAGTTGSALLLSDGRGDVLRLLEGFVRPAGTLPADSAADSAAGDRHSDAWWSLDVALLHAVLVPEVWGLQDDPTSVCHAHDVGTALALAGAHGTAVLLNPPAADTVLEVAAAGDRMPRKSTGFGPKPLSGLLLRAFDDQG